MSDPKSPARPAGRTVVRRKKLNRWNERRRQLFLITLTETANVRKSAEKATMSLSAAYLLKGRDPAFARAWRDALDVGFSELELSLLRDSIEGTERIEIVEVGPDRVLKSVKTIKSRNHSVAMRLYSSHRDEVMAHREARDGADESEQETAARVRAHMNQIRDRLAAQGCISAGTADEEQGHEG